MTIDEMKKGIARIRLRLDDLEAFDPQTVQQRGSPEVKALETAIDETLSAVFGHHTAEHLRYYSARTLDNGSISRQPPSLNQVRRYLTEGKEKSVILLKQAIRGLSEEISLGGQSSNESAEPSEPGSHSPNRVFVVHGHNGEVKEAVARFITHLGFEPIILHERPNKGRTVLTKFSEESANVGYAVVLMTPDDLGSAKNSETLCPRARQNVVFELGFFIGKLGADKVAAIIKGDIEKPSDFDGVLYTSFDKEDWRTKLGQELKAAGYPVDLNKVIG